MYYKIDNKECEVYKKLHALRLKELKIEADNITAIEEKTGLKFTTFLGNSGQQNWRRVTEYDGFKFTEPDKVDPKIWKKHSEHEGIFIPNRKTKLGREMAEFILNGLNGSRYDSVFKILKIEHGRKFSFPYVSVVGEIIIIFLGDSTDEPKDKNIIEITKREFNELQK